MKQERTFRKRHGEIGKLPAVSFEPLGGGEFYLTAIRCSSGCYLFSSGWYFFTPASICPGVRLFGRTSQCFSVFPPFFRQKMGDSDQKKERCKRTRASMVKLHQSLSAFEGVAV